MTDADRLERLNQAFQSDVLQKQLVAWRQQRDMLRRTLLQSCEGGGLDQFKAWWLGSRQEVRAALALTALEDLPNSSSFAAMSAAVCPELEPESLLNDRGERVASLLDSLCASRENDEFDFGVFEQFQAGQQNNVVVESMKLARSCSLLQFTTAVLLVFENADSPVHDDTQ